MALKPTALLLFAGYDFSIRGNLMIHMKKPISDIEKRECINHMHSRQCD
jgi:hypothetical protein